MFFHQFNHHNLYRKSSIKLLASSTFFLQNQSRAIHPNHCFTNQLARSRRNFDAIDPGFQEETRNGDQSEQRIRISPLRRRRSLPPPVLPVRPVPPVQPVPPLVGVAGDGGEGDRTIRVLMRGGKPMPTKYGFGRVLTG